MITSLKSININGDVLLPGYFFGPYKEYYRIIIREFFITESTLFTPEIEIRGIQINDVPVVFKNNNIISSEDELKIYKVAKQLYLANKGET